MNKDVKLYNVVFPFWLLMLLPAAWLVVLPANFLIDSLVLIISMFVYKFENRARFYKKSILKFFLIGILSDLAGSVFMLISANAGAMGDELYLTIPAILISAVLIFVLNYFFTLKNCSKKERLGTSLIFAIATAPYTFLIPLSWLYK